MKWKCYRMRINQPFTGTSPHGHLEPYGQPNPESIYNSEIFVVASYLQLSGEVLKGELCR